jgi:hypothetical protein
MSQGVMLHEEAIRTHAAERYVLGEMSPAEREVYEDHYFACQECGTELSAAAAFLDNARKEIRTSQAPARATAVPTTTHSWWQRLIPLPPARLVPSLGLALVALLVLVGYQNIALIPQLRQELASRDGLQSVPTIALRSAARGSGPSLSVQAADAFVVLQADVLTDRPVARYTARLQTADGREQFRTTMAAPPPGTAVTLLVPAAGLAAGDYTLIFSDDDDGGREVGRFIFTLERD